jgi:hypothetical protein
MREIEIQLKNGAELIYFIRRDIEIRGEWLYVFGEIYSAKYEQTDSGPLPYDEVIKDVNAVIRLSEVVYYETT